MTNLSHSSARFQLAPGAAGSGASVASARDEILSRLRAKQRPTEHPPPWQSRRHFADPADHFTQALTAAHGEVLRARSLEEALEQVAALFQQLEIERAIANDQPPLANLQLTERWPDVEWHLVGRSEGNLRTFATTADIGLTGADAALAETGTIVVSSGPDRSRLTSLLPPVHLALVPTLCFTTDIFTWTATREGKQPASQTLISGPSKTADIEQTMAIGVHGPKRFIMVLYDG